MNNPNISELLTSSSTSDSFLPYEVQNNGGFLIYILILVYCCFALAVICDAYFVPSLQTLSDAYDLPPDVAGSTLMALGASVPELFASLIGVFITEDDIGTGSIIGSACFNLVAVPAACAFVAAASFDKKLTLTPAPIIRNSAFYSITILILVLIIKDNSVDVPESIILLMVFFIYMGYMIYSAQMSSPYASTNNSLTLTCSTASSSSTAGIGESVVNMNGIPSKHPTENRFQSRHHNHNNNNIDNHQQQQQQELSLGKHNGGSSMVLYSDYVPRDRDTQLFGSKVGQEPECPAWAATYFFKPTTVPTGAFINHQQLEQVHTPLTLANVCTADYGALSSIVTLSQDAILEDKDPSHLLAQRSSANRRRSVTGETHDPNGHWVTTKWIMIPMLPVTWTMRLLTPYRINQRVGRPKPTWAALWTFIVSIAAIGFLTYLAVWMVHLFGQFVGIPETVAGITILSWGTGIPELIASIVLIKKTAQVDMAICNVIGSNVIDISFCLSLPWLIKCIMNFYIADGTGKPVVQIQSAALSLTSFTLLITVIALLAVLRLNKWQMTVRVGVWLSLIYVAFVVVACMLESLAIDGGQSSSSLLSHLLGISSN